MGVINRLPMWMLVTAWVIVGAALPALSGWLHGVRDPKDVLVHDEASYLLQADTFARGRLTNRRPRHPEFFEAPYLFVEPTYQAKYPPAQALVLAAGQRFLGHPIAGVWLSCGLFAGALFWMLAGWTNRRWAFLGTEYAVAILGVNHYWATTYWGGMVAACGGALVLGGTRWTIRQGTAGRGLLTGLGAVILLNSRPYEGSVVCLACAPLLAWWLLNPKREWRRKVIRWCLPFVLVLSTGGFATAFYNRAVTGSWTTLPYALHPRQYMTCGMFRWQPINRIPERRLTTHAGLFYEQDSALNPGKPGGPQLGAHVVEYQIRRSFFDLFQDFISPANLTQNSRLAQSRVLEMSLLTLFLATTAWFLFTARRVSMLHAAWGVIVLEVLAGVAVWWSLPHYKAPIVCLCYFVAVDWLRRAALAGRRTRLLRFLRERRVILGFMVLIPVVSLAWQGTAASRGPQPATAVPSDGLMPRSSARLSRPQLLEFLGRQKRPVLAIVSYDSRVSLHDEWVYNSADLESQRVILAQDLGPNKLPLLIADFPDREVWRVRVTPRGAVVERDVGNRRAPE
jgi:hypothetical protein